MGIEDVPTERFSRQQVERARMEIKRDNTPPPTRETDKIATFLQERSSNKIVLDLPSYEDVRILNEWMKHSKRLVVRVNITPRVSVRISEIQLVDGGIWWSCILHDDEKSEATIEVKAGCLMTIFL